MMEKINHSYTHQYISSYLNDPHHFCSASWSSTGSSPPHMSAVGLFPDLPACLAAAAVSVLELLMLEENASQETEMDQTISLVHRLHPDVAADVSTDGVMTRLLFLYCTLHPVIFILYLVVSHTLTAPLQLIFIN